jgi:hypothetical protein
MRRLVGNRAMLHTFRYHEEIAGSQRHRISTLHLDAKRPVPTQEELVFIVMMPGKLAIEPSDANDCLVGGGQISRLPRSRELVDCIRD